MTDLEMVKACGKAMGLEIVTAFNLPHIRQDSWNDRDTSDDKSALKLYSPLTNDAQAMALVKRFGLHITREPVLGCWHVLYDPATDGVRHPDLNRAIVECVANMKAAK